MAGPQTPSRYSPPGSWVRVLLVLHRSAGCRRLGVSLPERAGAKQCFAGGSAQLSDVPPAPTTCSQAYVGVAAGVTTGVCVHGVPWGERYVESDHQPPPISRFPPSPFTFSSLPDTPLNKTESPPWAAMFPKFPREGSNLVCFSCLQSRIPAVMPGRVTHHGLPSAPSTFQHGSFPNSALLLSPFLHQRFSRLTRWGDQVCAVVVQPPSCHCCPCRAGTSPSVWTLASAPGTVALPAPSLPFIKKKTKLLS